uniref:hypothetical protein n=1 Tax=Acetatifactor sp. TaxID=1872090 RepID=UPI004055E06B
MAAANNKFYSVTKEINGKKYTAQFNGLSCAVRAVDQSYIEGSQNVSSEKLTQYIFDNVIVEPKGLTIDDFDSMDDLNAVTKFGREVMQGKFRDEANKNGAKA